MGLLLFPSWNFDCGKDTVQRGDRSYIEQRALVLLAALWFGSSVSWTYLSIFAPQLVQFSKKRGTHEVAAKAFLQLVQLLLQLQQRSCNSLLEWIWRGWGSITVLLRLVTPKYKWRIKSGQREFVLSDCGFFKAVWIQHDLLVWLPAYTDHGILYNSSCMKLVSCGCTRENRFNVKARWVSS